LVKRPNMSTDFVIEIEAVNGPCYVNESMDGDPGRTRDIAKAERYATENEARENYFALCRRYPNLKLKWPVRLSD
jgi:hypothetical protein